MVKIIKYCLMIGISIISVIGISYLVDVQQTADALVTNDTVTYCGKDYQLTSYNNSTNAFNCSKADNLIFEVHCDYGLLIFCYHSHVTVYKENKTLLTIINITKHGKQT